MTTSFNVSKDKIGWYVEQAAGGTGEIHLILLQSTNLEADATLADHATVAAILAGTTDEATFTNYVRKELATPTRTVDQAGNQVLLGGAAPGTGVQFTWTAAGGTTNNTLGKVLFAYAPAAASADTELVPLMATDVVATTDGNDLIITLHVDGFARVRNP